MLCLLAMITYMDRAANGNAKDAIMAELNEQQKQHKLAAGESFQEKDLLTKDDFFWVLIAFQLAYAIFEVPSGWLGDIKGPRSTLLRVVLWWSLFVAITGFVGTTLLGVYLGFSALILIQFFFGVGEAGAIPNIAKALYNWFPASQRGFAKSIIWMSASLPGRSDAPDLGADGRTGRAELAPGHVGVCLGCLRVVPVLLRVLS